MVDSAVAGARQPRVGLPQYPQPRVVDGVFERSVAFALASERNLDGLWAAGVLSLYAKLPDGREFAATQRDDWRAFLRRIEDEGG